MDDTTAMTTERRGAAGAELDEALLFLAPVRPSRIALRGSMDVPPAALGRWVAPSGSVDLVLVGPGGEADTADAAVVRSPASRSPRRAAGVREVAYLGWRAREAELVLRRVPVALARAVGARASRGRVTTAIASAAGSAAPAAVQAALPGWEVDRVLLTSRGRRRAAYVASCRAAERPRRLVKASLGADAVVRSEREQEVLLRLRALVPQAPVPEPLGHGTSDGLAWSVESAAAGGEVARAGAWWWRRHAREVLGSLSAWLEELAVRSAHPPPPAGTDASERGVHVRGPAASWCLPLLSRVGQAPAVLVHGDLGSGTNVLVDGRALCVIDWETAITNGLPLIDLLPSLCWGLARQRGLQRPRDQARFIVELCSGRIAESSHAFSVVSRYARRLGLPSDQIGPLAAISWAHHGSMRARHDEMLVAAGLEAPVWESTGELVLARWMEDPRLGTDWPAIVEGGVR